jgi:hypothetical protein
MSGREGARVLEPKWLVDIFVDAGLDDGEAQQAGEAARRNLLRRVRPGGLPRAGDIKSWLVRDPMASFQRLTGIAEGSVPFMNEDQGRLDEVALTRLFREVGLLPDVALAYAKVVVEAIEPEQFYQPVWEALGRPGRVDLETLKRLDWIELKDALEEHTKTTVAVRVEPSRGSSVRPARPMKKQPGRGGSGRPR